ncbi:unnamed protein product [Closterium sp. Naga37s-1]|nr:unnamed protein product [Closterium sp. Naga37s-1]
MSRLLRVCVDLGLLSLSLCPSPLHPFTPSSLHPVTPSSMQHAAASSDSIAHPSNLPAHTTPASRPQNPNSTSSQPPTGSAAPAAAPAATSATAPSGAATAAGTLPAAGYASTPNSAAAAGSNATSSTGTTGGPSELGIPPVLSAPLSASLSASLLDPFLSLDAAAAAQAKPVPNSGLYAWSCGHLSRPLLEAVCDAEAETRRAAREKRAVEGVAECRRATVSKVSDQIASFDTESDMMTEAVLLHPFLPLVCIADENEVVRIWNYEEGLTVSTFDNQTGGGGGADGHKGVSQLCLLNELDDTLLLVASRDGSYASGEISSILVWDLDRELLAHSVPTECDSAVTALGSSVVQPSYVAAGCDDGSVRLFDIRSQPRAQLVCGTHHHSHRVAGIAFHPASTSAPQIISASSSGEIVFLDARNPGQPIRRVEAHKGHLTALSVHRHLPVMATGSSKQLIRVFNMSGDLLSVVRYHNSFLGQRIGPVSALHFHPYRPLLAAGATDSIVSIYAGETHRS